MKEANGSPLLSVLPQGPFSVQQIHGASYCSTFYPGGIPAHKPLSTVKTYLSYRLLCPGSVLIYV